MLKVSLIAAAILLSATLSARADISVYRETVIGPASTHALAVVGAVQNEMLVQVGVSSHVRMAEALVEITVGSRPEAHLSDQASHQVTVTVEASFLMINESEHALELVVAFPLGESINAGRLEEFIVEGDGEARSVFRALGPKPKIRPHLLLQQVAGPPDGEPPYLGGEMTRALPKAQAAPPFYVVHGRAARLELAGTLYNELMLWQESFAPREQRRIAVSYSMSLPIQWATWHRLIVAAPNPHEVDMVPLHFLEELDQGARYVFFDYVLSTGATWKDSIGEETVWLKLDPSWAGARLYMHAMEAGEWRTEEIDRAGLETAVRVFRRTGYSPAPDEVVYFALSHEDR